MTTKWDAGKRFCPIHGTPMYYSKSEDLYACSTDVDCVNSLGVPIEFTLPAPVEHTTPEEVCKRDEVHL